MLHPDLPVSIRHQILQMAKIVDIFPSDKYAPEYILHVRPKEDEPIVEITVPVSYLITKVPFGTFKPMLSVVESAPLSKINPKAAIGGLYVQYWNGMQDFQIDAPTDRLITPTNKLGADYADLKNNNVWAGVVIQDFLIEFSDLSNRD